MRNYLFFIIGFVPRGRYIYTEPIKGRGAYRGGAK